MSGPQNGHAPADAQQVPYDVNNPMLSEGPGMLFTALVPTPGGQRLALTIRTPSATVTVFLARDDAQRWRDALTTDIGKMTGLILPPGQ